MLEQSDKNETMFVYIVLIVCIFNIVLGYKDSIKELPYTPWPSKKEDEKYGGSSGKPKTAKEMNKLKKLKDKEL